METKQKLIGIESVPENGITIDAETLKRWVKKLNVLGYDAPDSEFEWLNFITYSVNQYQFNEEE